MSLSNPEFNARIARISSGQASSKSTLFVGLDEVYHITYPRRGKSAGPVAAVGNVMMPVFMAIAIGLGVLCFGLASWIRFQFAGVNSGSTDALTEMGIQAGAALVVVFLVARALPFRARALKVMMAVAAVSTTFLYHNAVHIYPESFAQVFSPTWVEFVQASTKPQSIVWQGQSFTF